MSQAYSNPKRESDPHALPDVEVWQANYCDDPRHDSPCIHIDHPCEACRQECNPHAMRLGWFWQSCFPGCLPDSDPIGPFATEAEALADAQSGMED